MMLLGFLSNYIHYSWDKDATKICILFNYCNFSEKNL
jgi:hypothetical protein